MALQYIQHKVLKVIWIGWPTLNQWTQHTQW